MTFRNKLSSKLVYGQKNWVCSFAGSGASVISKDFTPPIVRTGVTYNQASSTLNILTGTTANSEFLTRSQESWCGTARFRASLVASQRIANQNLAIMLADLIGEGLTYTSVNATTVDVGVTDHGLTAENVGQFMNLGGIVGTNGVPGRYAIASIPNASTIRFTVAGWPASGTGTLTLFGHNFVRNLINGTTATTALFTTQRDGWSDADTSVTINTTASPGTILQNELLGREVTMSNLLRASTTSPSTPTLATRFENIPDEDTELHVFIWSYNGSTAPASTTTWSIGSISVEDYADLPVTLQASKAQSGYPFPVAFTATSNSVTLGAITSVSPTINTDTTTNLTGNATFTGTSRDAGTPAAFQRVAATFVADQVSATNGARIEFSTDGTTWRSAVSATLVAGVPVQLSAFLTTRYWRVVLVNGASAQTQVLVTSGQFRI